MQTRFQLVFWIALGALSACQPSVPSKVQEGHFLFPNLEPAQILQIEILRHPTDGLTPWQAKLTRNDEHSPWVIQSSSQTLKDSLGHTTLVNHFLSTLKTLRVKKVHPPKERSRLGDEGIEPPIDWIKWGDQEIRLGRETNQGRFAYWNGELLEVDGASLKILESLRALSDVRLKKILPLNEDSFVSLKILEKGRTVFSAERQSGQWMLTSTPKPKKLPSEFSDVLKYWIYLQAERFLDEETEWQKMSKFFSKQKPSYEIIFITWKGQSFRQTLYLWDQRLYSTMDLRQGMLVEVPLTGLGTLQELLGRNKKW